MKWSFHCAGPEGGCRLFGTDIFSLAWEPTGEQLTVRDPLYPAQSHSLRVYRAVLEGTARVFAAGEFSSGMWGFYLSEE